MMTLGPGARAPEFSMVDLDSEEHRLGTLLRRGPVVLAIGKSSCATCDLAFPCFQRLYEAYSRERWGLIALLQDTPSAARHFARRLGLTFPVAAESAPYPVSRDYDPEGTPSIHLIDAEGRIADASTGFGKAALNRLSAELARLVGEPPVEVAPAGDGKPSFRPG